MTVLALDGVVISLYHALGTKNIVIQCKETAMNDTLLQSPYKHYETTYPSYDKYQSRERPRHHALNLQQGDMRQAIGILYYEWSELNHLVGQGKLAEYWERTVGLLYQHLPVRAVSTCLFDGIDDRPDYVVRVGDLTEQLHAVLDQKEQVWRKAPNTVHVEIGDVGGWPDLMQTVHFSITMDGITQGVVSLVFDATYPQASDTNTLPHNLDARSIYDMVQTFASHALRAQHLRDTRHRLERVNILFQTTQAVTSTLELSQVFTEAAEMVTEILDVEAATLYRVDEEAQELYFMITQGDVADVLAEKRIPLNTGVVGWVATHGERLVVNDTRKNHLFFSDIDTETGFQTRSILCVPLRVQDRIVGVLEAFNKRNNAQFDDEDADWLEMMGRQIAVALDNAQLFAREQTRTRELTMLNEMSQTVNRDLDVSTVLHAITQNVLEISEADRSELWVMDPTSHALRLSASAGYEADDHPNMPPTPLGMKLAVDAIHHNEPLVDNFVASSAPSSRGHLYFSKLDKSRVAVVPLNHRGRVTGAIVVFSFDERAFTRDKLDVLQIFANQAAIALRNAELYQNLRNEQELIIKAQEEVRHQLARDLHDNTAQMLNLIIMNLGMMERHLKELNIEAAEKELSGLEELARQSNQEVRTLLFELRPIILESRGLVPALEAYHRQLALSLDAQVQLETELSDLKLGLHTSSAIFMIIQEAINNIRKYAKAENVWIRLYVDAENLYIEIEDDGIGFDVQSIVENYDLGGSLGLLNMRERTAMLGGELNFISPSPKLIEHGTLIHAVIALEKLNNAEDEPTPNLLEAIANQ